MTINSSAPENINQRGDLVLRLLLDRAAGALGFLTGARRFLRGLLGFLAGALGFLTGVLRFLEGVFFLVLGEVDRLVRTRCFVLFWAGRFFLGVTLLEFLGFIARCLSLSPSISSSAVLSSYGRPLPG